MIILGVPLASLAGSVAGAGGLATIRKAWQSKKSSWHTGLLLIGWGCVVLSLVLFALPGGTIRGLAIGTCVLVATAWVVVALNISVREARGAGKQRADKDVLNQGSEHEFSWNTINRVSLAAFLSMLAAFAIFAAQVINWPGSKVNGFMISACVLQATWTLGMIWALFDSRFLRPAIGLIAITAIAAAAAAFGLNGLKMP